MRKIVLGAGVSLDGYIARLDGSIDFLYMPEDASFDDFMTTIDTQLMGRKTYEASLKLGAKYGSMETHVFSRSAAPGTRDGVTFTRESPEHVVEEVRRREGKKIWLAGGGELARAFFQADLVDEIHLGIEPVLIGEGIPLFPPGFPQRNFKLVENRLLWKRLVEVKYERDRG